DMKNLNAAIANIGITYECMGKYKLALESNDELLDLAAAVGDRYMMSAAYCNRGVNYENMGYFEDAEKNYFESMKISENIGDIEGNALMLRNIGSLYLSRNDYDRASIYLNKSLEISEKINLEWNLLELYIVLIELNLIFYKLEWAEKFCNKLKNIVNKSDYDNSQKLNAYRNIIIFYKSKNNEEKIKAVEKTALLVQKIQKTEDKAKISYQVAKMYYDMNNKNKTDKSIKIALEILNRIYSSQPKKMFKILIDDLLKMKI
ncbi:MAG: tetratricopeptide repeat protein, partial [Candidatus Delongbacteria bacterium]